MHINFRTLQNRNFLLFIFALIITVSSVLTVTLTQTYEHSSRQLDSQFTSSRSVLTYKLETDAINMKRGLVTASKDFTIKTLIRDGKEDPESLKFAMLNYQKRLNSDFIAVLDDAAQPIYTNIDLPEALQLSTTTEPLNFAFYNGRMFLIAAQPVKFIESVPQPNAWLLTGVDVQRLFASTLRKITNFEVTLRYDDKILATSMDNANLTALKDGLERFPDYRELPKVHPGKSAELKEEPYIVYQTYLAETLGKPINVFFSLSQATAKLNYENLIIQLSIAIAIIMVIILMLTFSFSRSISKPLKGLAKVANEIRKGKYQKIKQDRTLYEVESLAKSLSEMQDAIQTRERENYQLAFFSRLTELPNRTYFSKQLKIQIETEADQQVAILWMDIDRFKDINDTLGHEFGDDVIRAIANRLNESRPGKAFLAYLDGDEFAAFVKISDENQANLVAQQFAHLFEQPFNVNGVALDVTPSIGVSLYPYDSVEPDQLTQFADIALYEAKDQHDAVARYSPENNKYSVVRLSLMTELKNAIDSGQLQLNFQPKVDIKTGLVVSAEALVRWIHPQHGFIFPDDFIPLAEQTGNIRHLTHWAIEEALKHHLACAKLGYDVKVAVNISAIDLSDLALPPFVAALLEKHQVSSSKLILEVTESAIMSDPEQAMKALNMLKAMNIKLSIDDFGTGYSSMEQLKRAPVDELKIDKSFVLDLANNQEDFVIVRSITSLAHNLGLTIVAEGVEDQASLATLNELNVETAQGYLISKPINQADFLEWLKTCDGKFIVEG